MTESADVEGLNPSGGNTVRVRVPLRAPLLRAGLLPCSVRRIPPLVRRLVAHRSRRSIGRVARAGTVEKYGGGTGTGSSCLGIPVPASGGSCRRRGSRPPWTSTPTSPPSSITRRPRGWPAFLPSTYGRSDGRCRRPTKREHGGGAVDADAGPFSLVGPRGERRPVADQGQPRTLGRSRRRRHHGLDHHGGKGASHDGARTNAQPDRWTGETRPQR